jgi:hypothetical protein
VHVTEGRSRTQRNITTPFVIAIKTVQVVYIKTTHRPDIIYDNLVYTHEDTFPESYYM